LYDSGISRNLQSTSLKGEFTTADALQMLLAGTSLSARAIAQDAVTIEPLSQESVSQTNLGPAPEKSPHNRYFGLIQASLVRAFCKGNQLRPGGYRAVLTFQIAATGEIRQPRLIGTTGNDGRDRMIARTLYGMSVGSPPPPDLQQPIMMVILPQSSGHSLDCSSVR
jgi:hypothetical protein